jgi:hypothetical protein
VVAFCCYHATLLPGLDLGDSASFQTGAGFLTLTPRQAYPLYYALGGVFVWLVPAEPARAMNIASAVYGAIAVGLATWLIGRFAESRIGAVAGGLFLGFSHTFWTQAITAEVYTLHLLLIGVSVIALLAWARRPSPARLAVFYGVYALGFGNHLSMILLLPAFAVFLLLHGPRGNTHPLHPRMVALACGVALLGALQYAWNLRGLWVSLEPPASFVEGLSKLWFDVTKADWRETLVMNLSEAGLGNRPAMFWFDVRQQFGIPGVLLGTIGFSYLVVRSWRSGVLLGLAFLANTAFAWTYNVGDAYIFFLPSHYILAICAGLGVAAFVRAGCRVSNPRIATAIGVFLSMYPAWRGYDTFPAVDRSWDHRAVSLLNDMTSTDASPVLRCHSQVFGLDANWQVQNAIEYYARRHKPELVWFVTDELIWLKDAPNRFREFVDAAMDEGAREVLATDRLLSNVRRSGSDVPSTIVDAPPAVSNTIAKIPDGGFYVLGILRPDDEYFLDIHHLRRDLGDVAPAETPELDDFSVLIGRKGERPVLVRTSSRPFRASIRVGDADVDVRMESWLPTDTIRRSGFGHVTIDRRHVLTLERGVSLAYGTDPGLPLTTAYHAGLFEPPRRFRVGSGVSVPAPCYR